MRKIYSNPILLLPVNFVKKFKSEVFTVGFVAGAISTLLINVVTFQIQEMVQKQRVLEALESEIFANAVSANNLLSVILTICLKLVNRMQ